VNNVCCQSIPKNSAAAIVARASVVRILFILFHRTSAMRVKAPPRGFVPSAPCWNPNVLSSLLQNQPIPALRVATIFFIADRDLRNKRSPRHAERSACRAITRVSGGEQPTHIYSIPTSAVRGLDPSAGRGTLAALLGVMLFQLFDTFNLRDNIGIWG